MCITGAGGSFRRIPAALKAAALVAEDLRARHPCTYTARAKRRPWRRRKACGGQMAGANRSIGTGARGPSGILGTKQSRTDLIKIMLRSATKVSLGELGKDRSLPIMVPPSRKLMSEARPRDEDTPAASGRTHFTTASARYSMTSSARQEKAWRSVPCQGRLMFRRKKRPQLAKNIIAESEGIIKFGILTGGGGRDVLTRGDGNDTFVFSHQSDSPAVPLAAGFIQSVDIDKGFYPRRGYSSISEAWPTKPQVTCHCTSPKGPP